VDLPPTGAPQIGSLLGSRRRWPPRGAQAAPAWRSQLSRPSSGADISARIARAGPGWLAARAARSASASGRAERHALRPWAAGGCGPCGRRRGKEQKETAGAGEGTTPPAPIPPTLPIP